MAKGDSPSMGVPQAPKQDQYSVMHKLMDSLGSTSMAPSEPPSQVGGQYRNDITPYGPINSQGGMFQPNMPQSMGGRFTGGMGLPRMGNVSDGGAGSMAPSNPQEMMRRTIMSKGTFGQ